MWSGKIDGKMIAKSKLSLAILNWGLIYSIIILGTTIWSYINHFDELFNFFKEFLYGDKTLF